MVNVEKQYYLDYGKKEEWEKLKRIVHGSSCQYDGGKCSVQCVWLFECDECEEPFCFLSFKTIDDGKEVFLCRDTDDQLCEDCHFGCDCYERGEPDNRVSCEKCGFKTDSKTMMRIHSCIPTQKLEVR